MYVYHWREASAFSGKTKFAAFLTVLLFAGNVLGGQARQLDSLINVAVRNNPEIKMARYQSMAAQSRIGPATQLPDPMLTVSAMNVPTDFTFNSDMMTMAPNIMLMQKLPWFGKLGAAGEVQRYSYRSTADRLSSVVLDVATKIKKVYGQIYGVEESIRYLKYKEQLLRSVVKVAEQLFAVGQVPQQDVFRATAELTMVKSNIIDMRSRLGDLEASLGALLGNTGPENITVDTLLLPALPALDSLEARLGRNNPQLKQIRNLELASRAKTMLARKASIPDISVGVSYGFRNALMANGQKASNMVGLQVGVSLPVFFGAKQENEIDEADLMSRATEEQYQTAELSLYAKLRSTYSEARGRQELMPLYSKELIPQYEATYNSSLSSYSVGKTSFAMLISNLTTLINSKIEMVKIEAAYFEASAEISNLIAEGAANYGGER